MESRRNGQVASYAVPDGRRRAGTARRCVRRTGAPRESGAARRDAFFRHIVAGMRNGVLAITRDGALALINDEAYRIFGITASPTTSASPLPTVLADHPDVVRVLAGAFELHHLPNRAEMRLKPSGKVIGYTLALVRDDDGDVIGAAMFFKDLTRVEQLEERERLRDRLAAVGEMAAVIAHEVKNPLAGIEVMAGLLRRKIPDAPDAQIGADRHHQRSQDGQRHRAGSARLRPADPAAGRAHRRSPMRCRARCSWPIRRRARGDVDVDVAIPDGLPHDPGRPASAHAGLHQPADERLRGDGRQGTGHDHRAT